MEKIVETWQLLTVFAKHESKRSMIFISVKPVITFFNIYPNIISASRCHAWESNTTLAVSIVIFCSIFNTLEGRRRDRQCMGSLWWGGVMFHGMQHLATLDWILPRCVQKQNSELWLNLTVQGVVKPQALRTPAPTIQIDSASFWSCPGELLFLFSL